MDPVCGPIVQRYLSTHSLALVLQLDSCAGIEECKASREP
jgi:hypothetical protein